MTWTNAFDVGACTVSVSFAGAAPVFSAVMAKGTSQPVTNGANQYTVAVDANGIVSLSGPQLGGAGGSFAVYVTPVDASLPMRISTLQVTLTAAFAAGANLAKASGDWADATWDASLFWGGEGGQGPWQPDPCAMPAGSPRAGLYAQVNGS